MDSWANFPSTAGRFGDAILNHLDLLKEFPYIGSPVQHSDGMRQLVHTPILIFYQVNEARHLAEVLHFWHGSRRDRY